MSVELELRDFCNGFMGIPLPCFTLFSRIPAEMGSLYMGTIAILALLRFYVQLSKVAVYESITTRDQLKGDNARLELSQNLFNAWDWRLNTERDRVAECASQLNIMLGEMEFADIVKMRRERTEEEWRSLYIKRAVYLSLNALFIGGCCALIFIANVNAVEMTAWLEGVAPGPLKDFSDLAPTIVLSGCNSAINPVTIILVGLGEWDFKDKQT